MSDKKSGGLWEVVKTLLYAGLIAFGVRTAAYEPFNIPSGSMIPTLLIGDFLFVAKYAYGYSRHSLPFSMPLIPGRIFFHEPERGDVIVFKLPSDGKTDYIKRLIGLPGDQIQVLGGVLQINGVPVQRERIGDYLERSGGSIRGVPQYIETLPGGRKHRIIEEKGDNGAYDNTVVYAVPPGTYFMMGDNRDNSNDSRIDVGFVPKENFVGRAEVLFFSIDDAVWKFWLWPSSVRFGRLFESIE